MKADEIFQYIGEFQYFQWLVYSAVCISSVVSGMVTFAQVFLAPSVDHWCAVSEWADDVDECLTSDKNLYLECIHNLRNASIPLEEDSYSKCSKYDVSYPTDWYEGFSAYNYTNVTIPCDEGWVYDRSVYQSSIIMEFDLVCSKENYKEVEQAIYFGAYFIATLIFGTIADRFGRYKAFYISSTLVAFFGAVIVFAPTFWFFVTFRFLQGCSYMMYDVAFVIGMEFVGPSKRVWAGTILSLFFAVGYILLAFLAFFITSWRFLQVAITAFLCSVFLYVSILPESIRWLISKKKYEEAEKVILKAARINKTSHKLPQNFMDEIKREAEKESESQSEKQNPYIQDIFRTKRLCQNSLNLAYQWGIISLVYYGLSLSTSTLGSNDYVTFCISGAVEIPATVLCMFLIDSFLGRRGSMFIFQAISGIACICTSLIPPGVWRTAVGMIGKFGISASYTTIYVVTAEIFPTPVRGIGTAMCLTTSNIVRILSSVVLILSNYWEPMPYVIFGSASVVGAFLCLVLPETRGKPLPESMHDAEMMNNSERERIYCS
ncbi:Organic cation transporter protein [Holothuria leucospilota]|uniref:Organic cation transporter protein n=1 Tax=Holothuria leucospilota TaxID=206669 RepID=A0A9Q1BMZ1_HOLLE|nr:Organic cation transporter protein [Holothuria leucospilota]